MMNVILLVPLNIKRYSGGVILETVFVVFACQKKRRKKNDRKTKEEGLVVLYYRTNK